MPTPGVDVQIIGAPARRGVPSSSGRLFLEGITERGPVGVPTLVSSVADWSTTYGDRVSYAAETYDFLDAAFNTGIADCYFIRVVGPTPTSGSLTRNDKAGTPLPTLTFTALYVGAYSARIKVQVAAGSTSSLFTIVVLFDDVEVERYTDLATPAAAVTALLNSAYIRATNLSSATVAPNNNPATAAAAVLSTGTGDQGNASDTEWSAALTYFPKNLGIGQVTAAGRTTATNRASLLAHAALTNRVALLAPAAGLSSSALIALRATDAVLTGANAAAYFPEYLDIPGLVSGTTRSVPGTAVAAGLIAASDASRSTNEAAAGNDWGNVDYALKLTNAPFTDTERQALNAAGINTFRIGPKGVQLYGFRSISTDPNWVQFTWARLKMELAQELTEAGENFVFRQLSKGTLSDFRGALLGVFAKHYRDGALYGETPEEAYDAVTDASVNTPVVLAAGELRASCWAKFSPFAEHVVINVTKSLIA